MEAYAAVVFNVTEFPLHILVSFIAVTCGFGNTFIVILSADVQLLLSITVTKYFVVSAGLAMVLFEFVADNPFNGYHLYVL